MVVSLTLLTQRSLRRGPVSRDEDSMSSCAEENHAVVGAKKKRKLSKGKDKEKEKEKELSGGLQETTDISISMNFIKKERDILEEYLFNEANKINKSAVKYILSKWTNLEAKLHELVLENEILKTRLTCQESNSASQRSYAQVLGDSVGVSLQSRPGVPETKRKEKKEIKTSDVIIIKPIKKDDSRTNDEIRASLTQQLAPIKNKLKVKSMRQTRRKGLLIEVDSKQDVQLIKQGGLEKAGLKAEEPKKIDPSIIIYDVEKDLTVEEMKSDFVDKNLTYTSEDNQSELKKKIEFRTKFNNTNGRVNWVVQLPGKCFTEIINKEKVYMCWRVYRSREFINIMRCFKCHGYGHIAT
ncbi:hypothetical protein KPH14_000766 [Odynerus spinipes]|uniref:Uncharacterized protein n=1 Tax=Odynerus spinipes TaxID=1348599 RepID=A0AAD9VKS3_9HYME|nr:hypothetical protein KPH14_000766 [Odynerus spinipes]